MKNDSIWNRIPLPVLIGGWLLAVIVGVVLIFTQLVNKPEPAATLQAISQNTLAPVKPTANPAPIQSTAVSAQPATSPTAQPTVNPKFGPDGLYPDLGFGYGVQVNGLINPADAADLADRFHARWIKQQLEWGVYETHQGKMDWTGFDGIINAAHDRGLRVMLSIVSAPTWTHPNLQADANDPNIIKGPPDDPNAFANFVGQVVDRYKGKVEAIEVWNEQNLQREWRTLPQELSAKRYVELLSAAYQSIKQRDPNIIVISGALSPTGVDDGVNAIDDFKYQQQLIDAGLLDVVDCVGAHHNGYNVGPNVGAADAQSNPKAATANFKGPFSSFNGGPPHHSWFFKDTLQGYANLLKGRKPLCVTEFGWASSEGYPDAPPGFGFAKDNTVQEQGNNIVEAYKLMKEWGFVKLAFMWNLDYGNKGKGALDDTVPYSLIAVDGTKRDSFNIVRVFLKQITGD